MNILEKIKQLVFNLVKPIQRKMLRIFSKKVKFNRSELFTEKHDCSLLALYQVLPYLESEKIVGAFSNCCMKWPYGGVTNKEFNIALRFLNVFEQFDYNDDEGLVVKDFLKRNKETFILLIPVHFTVITEGKRSEPYICSDTKVYCSWRLIQGT